ncbi:DUF2631 domain-containing protein [Williamsia sterculiae]|uniref:DUF2631 domain-containing protein n=1 Tax=Williamsia sterculiae TaxID=1344003 RepID=A0A1N7GEK6_9NOCA|nr:DUF2631 domain-containing protein [Williamsia sterculiae]SIS11001.1 Protein of unknown function [Williamsia sterculiae]
MASNEVEHASHGQAVEWRHEPTDAPSARFGWHGEGRKTMRIAAVVSLAALLFMIIGNQKGHVEDLYLIGFAVVLGLILLRDWITHRGKWKNGSWKN